MTEHAIEHHLPRPDGAPPLYAQDGAGHGAVVHAHYFVGACDWFITEYDPGQDVAFGWACLGDRANAELGYVSLAELESIQVPLTISVNGNEHQLGTMGVERDQHWPEGRTLAEAIAGLENGTNS